MRLLPSELVLLGITKPLVITDQGIRQAGILGQVTKLLHSSDFKVFDDTPENPNEEALRQPGRVLKRAELA